MKAEPIPNKYPSSLNKLLQKLIFDKNHQNNYSKYLPQSLTKLQLFDNQFNHLLLYWHRANPIKHRLLQILKALNILAKVKLILKSLSY
jgi:hypothetical protein